MYVSKGIVRNVLLQLLLLFPSCSYIIFVPEVLNCRRADYLLEDDCENEKMCELETPKISKVLDIISEVMNCIDRVIVDCGHLHP
jgi:hypothetical protein